MDAVEYGLFLQRKEHLMGRLIIVRTLIVVIVGTVLPTAANAATITVSWDGTGDYLTIQEGIDAASDGDEVIVCDGTYIGTGNKNLDFGGKAITVRSENGPASCIINCEESGRGFYFHLSETDTSVVDGFTITNGDPSGVGGGIACQNSSSPTIMNCVITNNYGSAYGGAIFCNYSDPIIVNCTMANNVAVRGGAIALQYISNPTITNCTITGNTATASAGALYSAASAPDLTNCILWGDDAAETGPEIFLATGDASTLTVSYSDVEGGQAAVYNEGNYSTVNWDLISNIDAGPLFVGPATGDYHLQAGSPCIDAGDDSALPPDTLDLDGDEDITEPIPFDLDGYPRIGCAAVDLGAYESSFGGIQITCPANTDPLECPADTSPAATGVATAFDGCTGDPIAVSHSDDVATGTCPGNYEITRTWVAVGHPTVACDQVITVVDTTAPALTVPAGITVECDASTDPASTGSATASDNCDTAPAVTHSDSVVAGSCPNAWTITRTWTATDACGNSVSAAQVIAVADSTAPALTVPVGITVECDESTEPASTGWAAATDNCDPAPAVTHSDSVVAGSCPNAWTITRTWTATDACGNIAEGTQTITVQDTTSPSITCPAAVTVECLGDVPAADFAGGSASDNCDPNPTVTHQDMDNGGTGCASDPLIITRTYRATDACANFVECAQTITVVDTTEPVLTVDTTAIVVTDADCSGDEAVTLPVATATDNCDTSVVITNDAPAAFPAGATTTVTFTATDDCGNAAIEQQVDVTVKYGATIRVIAKRYTFGFGTRPWITREPLVGITVAAFEKSPGSCAWDQLDDNWWILWWALPDIFANCTPVTTAVTDEDGLAYLDVPPGNYVVASHFDSDGDGEPDMYLGQLTCGLECGEMETERLFMLHLACGRRMCARWHRLTGSELIVVEPEEVLWDGEEQPYPFAFDSDGVWDVTVSVAPPEGFVSDFDELSENVDNELEAVQFNITEVGSDLVPTQTRFEILHRGQRHIIESEIGIRLTPDYARQRGFDVDDLRARGLIKEKPKARAGQPQPKP